MYKVTPDNIRVRYLIEKANHGTTVEQLALQFGLVDPVKYTLRTELKNRLSKCVDKNKMTKYRKEIKTISANIQNGFMRFSRFMNKDKYQMIPPKLPICKCCKKSMHDHFREWINDGSINPENLKKVGVQ